MQPIPIRVTKIESPHVGSTFTTCSLSCTRPAFPDFWGIWIDSIKLHAFYKNTVQNAGWWSFVSSASSLCRGSYDDGCKNPNRGGVIVSHIFVTLSTGHFRTTSRGWATEVAEDLSRTMRNVPFHLRMSNLTLLLSTRSRLRSVRDIGTCG